MFDFLTDSIDNALGVIGGLVFGEIPSQRQVAKLIADGVSVYAIAEATGVAAEVIQGMVEDR